jgi:hypothetical protein
MTQSAVIACIEALGPAWLHHLLGNALYAASLSLGVAGCATWQAPADFDDGGVRARAVTASGQNVRVAAAVLSAEDSRRMFGADVNETGVQSVWIEVRNQTPEPLWLLSPGTDPDYFSPLEVAWSMHTPLARATNARIEINSTDSDSRVRSLGKTRGRSSSTRSASRDSSMSICPEGLIPFTLFLPVPDDAPDPRPRPILFSYPDAEITNYTDLAALREALERLPCCASDSLGTARGDPLNAVFVGELPDIAAALVRRSYRALASRGRLPAGLRRDPTPYCASRRKRARST